MKRLAIIVAAVLPCLAAAQEAAPAMPVDPRAPRFNEVERGFFTGFEVGWFSLFDAPKAADPGRYPSAAGGGGMSSGIVVGVHAGYDITNRVALSAYALESTSSASLAYGSFAIFSAGGDLRVSLLGARDRNGTERFRLYLHGRGGWLVTRPIGLVGNTDLYTAGGLGFDYDTHLRHFAIGLAVDGAYVVKAKSAGLSVTPTVRYTF
ncbi:MAG TPA: adventurous gliding motility protein CglE [Anaeromyxobacteraceae bacterium]|nr:adventurous gliding motility protein CglE [Anaeromyxobacteraceae bacterium]